MSLTPINNTNVNPDTAPQGADKINLAFLQNDATTALATTTAATVAANTTNIATNTANIATNTTNIATNTSGIAALTAPVASLSQRIVNRISIQASGDVTGATDSAAAIAAEVAAVAALRTVTGFSAKCGTVLIEFEGGDYYLNANAMLGGGGLASKGWGIRFVGRGQEQTVLHLLGTNGAMCVNRYWLQPQFDDLSIYSADPTNNFLVSLEQGGLSNIQDYRLTNCGWRGSWNHIALITGGNNNSEWKWNDCIVDSGAVTDWLCIPQALVGTMTNTSNIIAIANTLGTYVVGSTCTFGTAVGTGGSGVAINTTYFIVAASSSGISVSATTGGTAITFNAGGTSSVIIASDQFLNHAWHNCKFWDVTNGSWINSFYGGQFKFTGICDASNYHPGVDNYLFNLMGTAHAGGVCNFLADGLRVEHTSDNALLLHSQWDKGAIAFNNLDTSSQVGSRAITNEYVKYEIVNVQGASLAFRDSTLLGVHRYVNNSSNFQFQNQIRYEMCTLLDNPSAGNFIQTTAGANSGGFPRIRFDQCRNTLNAGTAGYHEIVDSDVNWYASCGGQPKVRRVSLVGTNSDWPGSGGKTTFRLPIHAVIVEILFFKAAGGISGAFQYTVQTQEATPTVLAGGAATPMAGANSASAITPYVLNPTTTPSLCFDVGTSDLARTIDIIDTLGGGRSGSMTAFRCLLSYIG